MEVTGLLRTGCCAFYIWLQCSKVAHAVNEGIREGRVDVCIQSTDKNFMVPVGGAIIASPDPTIIAKICKTYPGRASSAPLLVRQSLIWIRLSV